MHEVCRGIKRRQSLQSGTVLCLDLEDERGTRPSQGAERDEQQVWVHLALELLSAPDQEIILWHQFEGLSFAEIARRQDLEPDAVRRPFNRALPPD